MLGCMLGILSLNVPSLGSSRGLLGTAPNQRDEWRRRSEARV